MKKAKKRRQPQLATTTKPKTTLKEDMGKLLFEIGRIAFGGIVIVVLLRGELSDDILLKGGIALAAVCFILSLFFGKREIKTDKTLFHRSRKHRLRKERR